MNNPTIDILKIKIGRMLESSKKVTYFGYLYRTDIEEVSFFNDPSNVQISASTDLRVVYHEALDMSKFIGKHIDEIEMFSASEKEIALINDVKEMFWYEGE